MALRPRNGLSLCSGGGGLDMGLMLAEPTFHTRCFVEWDEYPRQALIAAQRAGYFAPAPIWDDVTSFDGKPFRGAFDTVLAGYPCQPFSAAGKRRGSDDERHLWPDVARIIDEVQPDWVFLENVPGHVSLGLETVLRELWDLGFTPAVGLFSAAEVGAPHERLRVFIVAHGNGAQLCADSGQPDAGANRRNNAGGRSGVAVGDAASLGRREGRPEPELRRGRDTASSAGSTMADSNGERLQPGHARNERARWDEPGRGRVPLAHTCGAGCEGREQPGSPHQRHRPAAHGPTAERGRPRLFPPGPSDANGWADALRSHPDLAPALGRQGSLRASREIARRLLAAQQKTVPQSSTAGVEGGASSRPLGAEAHLILDQGALESAVRRMADGLAKRSRSLRLLGNGVLPLAAAHAWRSLAAAHGLRPVDMEAAGGGQGSRTDGPVRAAGDVMGAA